MSTISQIKDSIQELAKMAMNDMDNHNMVVGTVIPGSVDLINQTCSVQPIDPFRTSINNVSFSNEDGVPANIIPADTAVVTVSLYDSGSGCIVQHGKIAGQKIAGEDHGGLIIAASMISILNNLADFCNNIKVEYNGHIHSTTVTVSTLGVPTPAVVLPTTSQATTIVNDGNVYLETQLTTNINTGKPSAGFHGSGNPANSTLKAALEAALGILTSAITNTNDIQDQLNQLNLVIATQLGVTSASQQQQQKSLESKLAKAQVLQAKAQANYDSLNNNSQ
jgi:hypothetical protein